MPATHPAQDQPSERAQRVADGLVSLVRRLLHAGQDLLESLQRGNTGYPTLDVARRFGSLSLAIIIARLTRGLLIARALEARLLRRRGPRPVPAVTRATRPSNDTAPPNPAKGRPGVRKPPIDEEAELRGTLPTAEEIAERIRHKPIGAVILEICRDLGITTADPDWQEIKRAIIFNGGNLVRLLLHWLRPNRASVAIALWEDSVARATRAVPACAHPP